MPELTPSTREAARRIGITETALRKAEQTNRIAREPDGQWDIDKTRRRLVETADPARSPLASGGSGEHLEVRGPRFQQRGPGGFRWNTSLTREDTGDGACELMWVEHVEVQ